MKLLPSKPEASLHLAAQASLVVLAILAVCGLADIAHVYIEDLFIARGYLVERPQPCAVQHHSLLDNLRGIGAVCTFSHRKIQIGSPELAPETTDPHGRCDDIRLSPYIFQRGSQSAAIADTCAPCANACSSCYDKFPN